MLIVFDMIGQWKVKQDVAADVPLLAQNTE